MSSSRLLLTSLASASVWFVIASIASPSVAHADPQTLLNMCVRDARNLVSYTEQRPGSQSGAIERWAERCIQGKLAPATATDAAAIKTMPGYREALANYQRAKQITDKLIQEEPARLRLKRCQRDMEYILKQDRNKRSTEEVYFNGFEIVCVNGFSDKEPITPEVQAQLTMMKSFPEWKPLEVSYRGLKKYFTERAVKQAADTKRRADENSRRDHELYNLRQRDCDSIGNDGPNSAFQWMRCEGRYKERGFSVDELMSEIRGMLMKYVHDDRHTVELTRATYVYFCMRHLKLDENRKGYPSRVLGCTWWADQLDRAKLAQELAQHPERDQILKRVDGAVAYLRQRQAKEYPAGSRDHYIHYQLRDDILAKHRALRAKYADDFAAVDAFEAKVEDAKVEGCEVALSERARKLMRGVKGNPAAIRKAIGEGPRYQVLEALAKCHYYNDRHAQAGSILMMLSGAKGLVRFNDKVYEAQYAEMVKDDAQAQKFPQQRGKKLSTTPARDHEPPLYHPRSDLEESWLNRSGTGVGGSSTEGFVSSVTKINGGYRISFKKQRMPVGHETCRKTNRIHRIAHDGTLEYETECRTTKVTMEWVGPDPELVPEARGVKPGMFVEILTGSRSAGNIVYRVARSEKDTAPVSRLSEFEL